MNTNGGSLLRRGLWIIGSFGGSFVLKLGSNIVLARLLAPEIFGVMVIVNSIKYGVELLTDVGIEQNIVSNKRGSEPDFFNTAWTMQVLRGLCLTLIFLACSSWLSKFYKIETAVFLVISFSPLVSSIASTSIFLLVKDLKVKQRNLFELLAEFVAFLIYVTLAMITPTVWALVIGVLCSLAVRSALSYLIPHPRHALILRREHVRAILHFGKWIMISSLIVYAATNFDRIYLGKVIPLDLLGVYGIARTIADIPTTLASRLSYQLIFPSLAAAPTNEVSTDHTELRALRWKFVLLGAVAMATFIAWADRAVELVYDARYLQAGGIMVVLLLGSWFSILANLNEATVLGKGRPAYNSFANMARLAMLIISLPTGYLAFGLTGAIAAIALSEAFRYALVLAVQYRLAFTFGRQDLFATMLATLVFFAWVVVRITLNLDVPWRTLATLPGGAA